MKKVSGERKARSDKKRDVKPTISLPLYECISRISYVTNTPIKNISEVICKKGLYSAVVIEYLSEYFRRDYWSGNHTLYTGGAERDAYKIAKGIQKRRISIRFKQVDHDKLASLAYSLDLTVSSATGLLLECSIMNTDIVNAYISNYVKKELDGKRMKQLREVLKYINRNNPYQEEITLGALISFLMEEFQGSTSTIQESIQNFLEK